MTPVRGHIGCFRSGLTALLAAALGVLVLAVVGMLTDRFWLAGLPTLVLPFAAAYAMSGSGWRVLAAFVVSTLTCRALFLLGAGQDMWVSAASGLLVLASLMTWHGYGLTEGRARRWAGLPLVLFGLPAAALYIAALPATGPVPALVAIAWAVLVPWAVYRSVEERFHALPVSPQGLSRLAMRLGLEGSYDEGVFYAFGKRRGVDVTLRSRYLAGPGAILVVVTVPHMPPAIRVQKGSGVSASGDPVLDLLLETEGPVAGLFEGLHAELLPLANEQGMTIEDGQLRLVIPAEEMARVGDELLPATDSPAVVDRLVDLANALQQRLQCE